MLYLACCSAIGCAFFDGQNSIKKDQNQNGSGRHFFINEYMPLKVIANNKLPGTLLTLTLKMILDKRKTYLISLFKLL